MQREEARTGWLYWIDCIRGCFFLLVCDDVYDDDFGSELAISCFVSVGGVGTWIEATSDGRIRTAALFPCAIKGGH